MLPPLRSRKPADCWKRSRKGNALLAP
jgi:hypothetical protein